MTEETIGITYCLVAMIHLVVAAVCRWQRGDFRDPELIAMRAIAWPVFDAVWLARKWRTWWSATVFVLGLTSTQGCYPYKDYLYGLPVTERVHNGQAVAIVSEVYGIAYRTPEVRWVVQDDLILTEDGVGGALGVTHDCTSWILWPPLFGPDPENSPLFAHTVFAHEIAHCALWLYRGDGDNDHSDVTWWGTKDQGQIGGLVRVAMDALNDQGL